MSLQLQDDAVLFHRWFNKNRFMDGIYVLDISESPKRFPHNAIYQGLQNRRPFFVFKGG